MNLVSYPPSSESNTNEIPLALNIEEDASHDIETNTKGVEDKATTNEDNKDTEYDNCEYSNHDYGSEGNDVIEEVSESNDIISESTTNDTTIDSDSLTVPTIGSHDPNEYEYNFRTKRNGDYSKHIGRVDEGTKIEPRHETTR